MPRRFRDPFAMPHRDLPPPVRGERILRWIMVALVVWGVVHAAGAWTLNYDPRRPLVVLACVGGFLGFWAAMLAARRRRLAHRVADGGQPRE